MPRKPGQPSASQVPKARCTARSKRTGEQCRAWATPGATVCKTHGGRAPQVVAKAAERVQIIRLRAEAADTLARLGVAIETTPLEALEAMLFEAAGNVAVLRGMVADLERGIVSTEWGENGPREVPHVLVGIYNSERDRLAKLAEACAKLGLDERRVRLAESQVERLFQAVNKAAQAVLTPELAATFRQALAGQLRTLTAG